MIRVLSIAVAFLALTLMLLPLQLIGLAFDLRLQRSIPHLYYPILRIARGADSRGGLGSTASPR